MQNIVHELRLSETISPYGVGAIVDVLGESLIAADTSWWTRKPSDEIYCDRLVELLVRPGRGRPVLQQAPTHADRAGKDTPKLMYWRFPAWRFCERCLRLSKLAAKDKGKYRNECEGCKGKLVPMRYVAVCKENSHIQDIPWFRWAHRGFDKHATEAVRVCRSYDKLRFVRSDSAGEGLSSLTVKCDGCGRVRPLSNLVVQNALRNDGIKCEGKQPWEAEATQTQICDSELIAVQRGATGNYIAERVSALEIPEERSPFEEKLDKVRAHDLFQRMVEDNGGPRSEMFAGVIAEDLDVDIDFVLSAISKADVEPELSPVRALKDGEWAAFVKKINAGKDNSNSNFVVDGWKQSDIQDGPLALRQLIAGIGQVQRVREVRALTGFRRYASSSAFIPADMGKDATRRPLLPAIELFGEGIFIQFDEDVMQAWESLPEVQNRAKILADRRDSHEWASRLDSPEPRFVALHTIAHLLIRRLAFASGYSSASLQERIFARADGTEKSAGILIYTAAGDAQGTLGGLVRLGEPKYLVPMLVAALADAEVCSNDPVCIESDRQGAAQLNLSACHGCTLISETSCEQGNRLLDRQLVIGGGGTPGLLEGVLGALHDV